MDGETDRGNYEDRHTPETGPKKVKKPAAKKAAKPKAKTKKKKPVAKRGRKIGSPGFYAKKKKKTVKKLPKRKTSATVARPERLDMRVSKAEKAKLQAKAKKLRRTVTSIMLEAIEKIK